MNPSRETVYVVCFSNLVYCLVLTGCICLYHRRANDSTRLGAVAVVGIACSVFFSVWLLLIPIMEITLFFIVGDRGSSQWLYESLAYWTGFVALLTGSW